MSKVKDGIVWVSTTKGLLLKIRNGNIIEQIKIDEQPVKIIQWNNYLFVSTPKGLLKLDTITKKSFRINKKDGLSSNHILDNSNHKRYALYCNQTRRFSIALHLSLYQSNTTVSFY